LNEVFVEDQVERQSSATRIFFSSLGSSRDDHARATRPVAERRHDACDAGAPPSQQLADRAERERAEASAAIDARMLSGRQA
jgi:hypothetical protein